MTDFFDRPIPAPDLTTGYGDHPAQVADLWIPGRGGPYPLVVALHGGWWRAEHDRAHLGHLCRALRDEGLALLNVEYRRIGMPGVGLDAMLEDVVSGIALAGAIWTAHPVVPGPPVLLGHSAGGHLALCAARATPVRGVVALAPISDLELAASWALGDGAVEQLIESGSCSREEAFFQGSPARRPPLAAQQIILHGVQDGRVPIAMSEAYVASAVAAGARVELRALEGIDHLAPIDPFSAAFDSVRRAIRDLIDRTSPGSP